MRILDLFAGCGGGSLGFHRCFPDAEIVAYEIDRDCVATYNLNFGSSFSPVNIKSIRQFPAADMVIGGPPCQGFSLGNTRKMENDPRNDLSFDLLRAAETSGAKCFVIENVAGIQRDGCLSRILEECQRMGFLPSVHYLSSNDHGVATRRKRFFIVGVKEEHGWYWQPPHGNGSGPTVRDCIGDLPEPAPSREEEELDWHSYSDSVKDRERASVVPLDAEPLSWFRTHRPDLIVPSLRASGKDYMSGYYGRMDWDKPSPVLKTTFYRPVGGCFTHPGGKRTITLREGARIMSFPDSFRFVGSKASVAKQIGNAIPPLLAFAVADSLKKQYFVS